MDEVRSTANVPGRPYRRLSWAFAAGAVGLGVVSALPYFRIPGPPVLSVEEPERVLAGITAGQYDLDFHVRNAGDRPLRVIGTEFS